jgi:hypothetical protein
VGTALALLVIVAAAIGAVIATSQESTRGPTITSDVRFGNVEIGRRKPVLVILQSGQKPIAIADVKASPARSGFTVAQIPPPSSAGNVAKFPGQNGCSLAVQLEPSTTCTIPIAFAPSTPGPRTGMLQVTYASGRRSESRLIGTGTGRTHPQVSAARIAFGRVRIGDFTTKATTLTSGSAPLTITGIGTGSPEFQLSSSCRVPAILAPTTDCTFTVTFLPAALGRHDAVLRISLRGGAFRIPLTGIGTNAKR